MVCVVVEELVSYVIVNHDLIIAGTEKEKLPPSIQHKIDCHITMIKKVCSFLPVTKIIVETAEFDIHKLKKPDIHGWEYQNGEGKGFYNIKQAVLYRDQYTCQICGEKKCKI